MLNCVFGVYSNQSIQKTDVSSTILESFCRHALKQFGPRPSMGKTGAAEEWSQRRGCLKFLKYLRPDVFVSFFGRACPQEIMGKTGFLSLYRSLIDSEICEMLSPSAGEGLLSDPWGGGAWRTCLWKWEGVHQGGHPLVYHCHWHDDSSLLWLSLSLSSSQRNEFVSQNTTTIRWTFDEPHMSRSGSIPHLGPLASEKLPSDFSCVFDDESMWGHHHHHHHHHHHR